MNSPDAWAICFLDSSFLSVVSGTGGSAPMETESGIKLTSRAVTRTLMNMGV